MVEIANNSYIAAIVVLFTQITFLYFRTLNVIYVAEKKIVPSIVTGNLIGIAWLVSITIGANAIMNLQWEPILAHLVGGSLGTYWGFKTNKK